MNDLQTSRYGNMTIADKICTSCVIIAPMLRYKIPGVPVLLLAEFILIGAMIICFVSDGGKRIFISPVFKYMFAFIIYAWFVSMINYIFSTNFEAKSAFSQLARLSFYIIFAAMVCARHFNIKFGLKLYCIFSVLNSVCVIIQMLLNEIIGLRTYLTIPFLIPISIYTVPSYMYYRASGFFFEPSHFATYSAPLLLLLLMDNGKFFDIKKNMKMVSVILISIALLICSSGTAIVFLLLIYTTFIVKSLLKAKEKTKFANKIFMIFILIILAMILIFFTDLAKIGISRANFFNYGGSSSTRIFNGYKVYNTMNWAQKIFGIGYENYDVYFNSNLNLFSSEIIAAGDYTNIFVQYLSGTGIIGITLYLMFFISLFIRAKGIFKIYFFIPLSLIFFSDDPKTVGFILQLCLIITSGREYKEENFSKQL